MCHPHASKDSSTSIPGTHTYIQVPPEANFPSLNTHFPNFKLRKLASHKVVFVHHFLRKGQKALGIPIKNMAVCYDWRVIERIDQVRDQIFKERNT